MGRDSTESHSVIAYGVIIKLPEDPSWPIFAKRLEAFVASKKAKEEEEESPAAKKSKGSPPTVLISEDDTASMTKEEEKMIEESNNGCIKFEDFSYELDIEEKVDEALEVILGKDHGLTMKYICASAGYEVDECDGPIPPVFLLASRISLEEKCSKPSADVYDLELATISEEERDAAEKKISLVLDQLGLETTNGDGKPGWKFATSSTLVPR